MERRHLALHFPWLPAERLIKTRAALPDTPFAIVEKQKGALRLAAVSQSAHLLGLMPGLPLADARARVPELPAFDADPTADLAWLERLADGCLRYTPRVMAAPPQGLILDIAGCHHLYGADLPEAEQWLATDLERRLRDTGLTVRLAFSPSSDAAMALAVHGLEEGAVQRLPVTALDCEAGIHHALRRAGLTHIGHLASRPRTVLASRFGREVSYRLARLLGEADSPIIPRRALSPILCEARFAEPVAHVDSVRGVIAELATDALHQLEERGEGARKLMVTLFRCDGEKRSLAVETAAPTRDVALLMRLFAERIETLADPLDPGFGYDQIALAILAAEPLAAGQEDFEASGAKAREALAALLARLSTRLGQERVTHWCAIDSHVPERVYVAAPTLESIRVERSRDTHASRTTSQHLDLTFGQVYPERSRRARCEREKLEARDRPLLLLNPPQPIEAIAEVPDGPPYRFRWKGVQHRVARHEGPERIAMPWWQGKGSDRLTRDYYRVEDVEGRRFWLFRHGLYGEKQAPLWYIHGLFA
jgi:protein ImuB